MFSVGICSSVITGVLLNAYNIHILILLSTWYITASYLDEVHHLTPAVAVPVCQGQGEYVQSYSGLVSCHALRDVVSGATPYLGEMHHLTPAVEVPVCQEQGEYIQP